MSHGLSEFPARRFARPAPVPAEAFARDPAAGLLGRAAAVDFAAAAARLEAVFLDEAFFAVAFAALEPASLGAAVVDAFAALPRGAAAEAFAAGRRELAFAETLADFAVAAMALAAVFFAAFAGPVLAVPVAVTLSSTLPLPLVLANFPS